MYCGLTILFGVAIVSQLVVEQCSWRCSCWNELCSVIILNNCISSAIECTIRFNRSRFSFNNWALSVEDSFYCFAVSRRGRNCLCRLLDKWCSWQFSRRLHRYASRCSLVSCQISCILTVVNVTEHHLKRNKREWKSEKISLFLPPQRIRLLQRKILQAWSNKSSLNRSTEVVFR